MDEVDCSRRDDFLLADDIVFLNHGSFGACPRPVFARYQEWQRELEAQPVEFLGRRAPDLLASARASLAAYVGCAADDIVYFPNVTHALNVVARSLPLQAGDEVLATDHEYGALERTWRFVCEKAGASYYTVRLPFPLVDPSAIVEAIWAAVTPRTRVIFMSHLTSPTAIELPIAEIGRRARERGIWTVIDGAHVPGHRGLDLGSLEVDFYGANCHKWLCAPKGSGFLYARGAAQPILDPLVVSWGWRSRSPGPSRFVDEQEQQGTRDLAAYLTVPTAIAYQHEHDWPSVRVRCHTILADLRRQVADLTGLPPFHPESDAWYGQMAALPIATSDPAALKAALHERFRIEVPVVTWQDRHFVRVSIQAYNDREDATRLVDALSMLLDRPRLT